MASQIAEAEDNIVVEDLRGELVIKLGKKRFGWDTFHEIL